MISLGDGIARIHGLDKVMAGELIEFPHGIAGLAMSLEEDQVGSVIMGDYAEFAKATRSSAPAKFSASRWGSHDRPRRQLARPAHRRQGPHRHHRDAPVERLAPGVIDRQPVREPMMTGLKAIDSMIPMGRGQRELIIGDRAPARPPSRSTPSSTARARTSSASTAPSARSAPPSPSHADAR